MPGLVTKQEELYFGLARCIASVDKSYWPDLCRDFFINPKDVEAEYEKRQKR